MPRKTRHRYVLPLLLAAGFLAFAGDEENPQYTFVIDGPCGETVFGPAGSTYDDGTLGRDLFFDREAFLEDADGDGRPDRKRRVPNDRPGEVWDVVLKTSDPRFGGWFWAWSVGAEGALSITDVTTLGTVACWRGTPECRRWAGGSELTALTGLPYGGGPQTEENHGAYSAILMKRDFVGALRGNDQHTVGKLRVSAEFPETVGESVSGRVFFAQREPAEDPRLLIGRGVPMQVQPFANFQITLDKGNPPLLVEDCEVTFRAVPPVAAFVRCDPNGDGRSDLADAIWTFNELFRQGPPPDCPESGDCNDDGERNLSDAVFALTYQFAGGSAPPAPFPRCGRVEGLEPEDCPFRSTPCPPE